MGFPAGAYPSESELPGFEACSGPGWTWRPLGSPFLGPYTFSLLIRAGRGDSISHSPGASEKVKTGQSLWLPLRLVH